jgi:hypothetical protein
MTMTTTNPATSPPAPPAGDPAAPAWLKRVPLLTGVLAAFAGFLAVRSAALTNQAIYHSNQAVLHQAQASDAWAEYQANSIKARIVETSLLTAADAAAKDALDGQAKDLRTRQPKNMQKAQDQESQRDAELHASAQRLVQKDRLDYAGMSVQLGIAMASVAALTRRAHAFAIGVLCGAIGAGVTVFALVMGYLASHQ